VEEDETSSEELADGSAGFGRGYGRGRDEEGEEGRFKGRLGGSDIFLCRSEAKE
jgi:hypothetical protein